MPNRRLALAALVAAPLLFAASGAVAADQPLAGTWTLDRAASDDVAKAIDAAVAPMNFAVRGIARGRLVKTNPVYQSVTIAFPADKASVSYDGKPAAASPASGSTVKWKRDDGQTYDLSSRLAASGVLTQTFTAPDGVRKNLFSVGADGRMTMAVTVTSSKLPKPLTYKLAFRKAG